MEIQTIIVIVIAAAIGVTLLQTVGKELGKLLRSLFTLVVIAVCGVVLWRGGAFEWVGDQLASL